MRLSFVWLYGARSAHDDSKVPWPADLDPLVSLPADGVVCGADNRKAVIEAIMKGGMAYLQGDKQRALGHGVEAVSV